MIKNNITTRDEDLIKKALGGSEAALARIITRIENDQLFMAQILPEIQQYTGRAHCIGFTGPPGAGKSSLINQVTRQMRSIGKKIGIIAVDPSSPFSGGAFLGDRIRMQNHYLDGGVFIRSMATRGSYGGLAQATKDVIKIMDACGFEYILVETVGVGQTELDVMQATDTTVVVLVPEGGDSVQAMKAGLIEIGDIFVINKSDRPGADEIASQLRSILQLNPMYSQRIPPIVQTQCISGIGIVDLVGEIDNSKLLIGEATHSLKRRQRRKAEFEEVLKYTVVREWTEYLQSNKNTKLLYEDVVEGKIDPYSLLNKLFPQSILNLQQED